MSKERFRGAWTRLGESGRSRVSIIASVGLAVAVVVGSLFIWSPWASAVDVHGIAFAKGCAGPTMVGNPYTCTFSVVNSDLTDTALDTLTFTSIVDVVHANPSNVSSGNILSSLTVAALSGG